MPVNDTVLGTSTVQINTAGDYEINYMVRVGPAVDATTISAEVKLNGTDFLDSTFQTAPLSFAEDTIYQGSVIVTLTADAVLDLAL